ncbi:MAG: cupin domain-containing protein [Gaiellales bacterium]|jgi:mannose-6-phosphate isomerase-like protein (cupin superfamily)
MPSVDLTTLPVVTTVYGRWQPLNGPLGVTAFGINGMACEPGEDFDISHDEAETGQQEAYVIVAGRVEFTIGSETVAAGPGQVVSAPDPRAVRSYRALEPGSRLVCVGAAPGAEQPFGEWIGEAAEGS